MFLAALKLNGMNCYTIDINVHCIRFETCVRIYSFLLRTVIIVSYQDTRMLVCTDFTCGLEVISCREACRDSD